MGRVLPANRPVFATRMFVALTSAERPRQESLRSPLQLCDGVRAHRWRWAPPWRRPQPLTTFCNVVGGAGRRHDGWGPVQRAAFSEAARTPLAMRGGPTASGRGSGFAETAPTGGARVNGFWGARILSASRAPDTPADRGFKNPVERHSEKRRERFLRAPGPAA